MNTAHDVIFGTVKIGKVLGLTQHQVRYQIDQGRLPVRRIGGRWAASRGALLKFIGAEPEPVAEAAPVQAAPALRASPEPVQATTPDIASVLAMALAHVLAARQAA
jgi:hypothetical protein